MDEHTKRITLQHHAADLAQAMADMQKNIQYLDGLRHGWSAHAADLAQRVADLEAEIERLRGLLSREQQARHAALTEFDRITEAGRAHIRRAAAFEAERDAARAELERTRELLRRERDELAAKYDELLVALHGIGRALGIEEADRSPYSITCGVLAMANRLAEIERAVPAAWIEHELQGTGLRHLHFERRPNRLRDDVIAPVWTALIARPAPRQRVSRADELAHAASPDRADHVEDVRGMVSERAKPADLKKDDA